MINSKSSLHESIPELDWRCSLAGTRSGLTALLLSTVAIALVPALQSAKEFVALEKYVALRGNLEHTVNFFKGNQCWQKNKENEVGQKAREQWSLEQFSNHPLDCSEEIILRAKEGQPIVSTNLDSKKRKESNSQIPKEENFKEQIDITPPSAPKGLAMHGTIKLKDHKFLLQLIKLAVNDLDNQELLKNAKSIASHRLKQSIINWEMFRSRLFLQRMDITSDFLPKNDFHLSAPLSFTFPGTKHSAVLTYGETVQLAKYEIPDMKELDHIRAQTVWIRLPWTPLPLQLAAGATFLEFTIFLAVAYFWLIQQEARRSTTYPASGTLLVMFSRTRFSQTLFLILVLIPGLSAINLAMESSEAKFSTFDLILSLSLNVDWLFAWLIVTFSITILATMFRDSEQFRLNSL
jgi:hypothetical protein